MKLKTTFLTFGLMLASIIIIKAQYLNSDYEIATWNGFTEAAITYTFDDNCPKQYTVAIPVFNEFDFNATFYPIISWNPKWDVFQDAVNRGHEIASHTINHPNLSELSDIKQDEELNGAKNIIDSIVTGQTCTTIAYPYCVPSKKEITSNYYIAARHCQGNIENSTPDDFYQISSVVCGSEGPIKTTNDFILKNEEAAGINGWCLYLLHGIDNDGGYSPLDSIVLRQSLEHLNDNRDKYWVATVADVVRYIRERNSAFINEKKLKKKSIQLTVTDTLDNNIYNIPITVRRNLPSKWQHANVYQEDKMVHSRVVVQHDKKYVEFDVVPDAGVVEIKKLKEKE